MKTEGLKKLWRNRTFRVVLVLVLALFLLLAVWRVFFRGKSSATGAYAPTDRETRLSQLLTQIEGVSEVSVMIGEENGSPVSAVVIYRGENGFLTRMRITDAAAKALSIPPEKVSVYPS